MNEIKLVKGVEEDKINVGGIKGRGNSAGPQLPNVHIMSQGQKKMQGDEGVKCRWKQVNKQRQIEVRIRR